MKLNVTQVLTMFDGSTMKEADAKGEIIDATLKLALVNALLAPSHKASTGVEKIQRYELAKRIYNGTEIELSIEEITLCKESIQVAYNVPLVVGQVCELLEKE